MWKIRKFPEAWATVGHEAGTAEAVKPWPPNLAQTSVCSWPYARYEYTLPTGEVLIITGTLTASWFYWGLVNHAGIALKIWDKLRERSKSARRFPCLDGRVTKSSLNALCSWESVIIASFCLKICSKAPPSWLDYWCQHLLYRQSHMGFTKKMEQQHSSSREALSKPKAGRRHRLQHKSQHTSHLHQGQSQRKSAFTLQHTAGGFPCLSFQIVTSTQAVSTNQLIEWGETGGRKRLAGCKGRLWDGGNGWGMRWKCHCSGVW